MTWTIDAIREADHPAGRYFFSAETIKFFNSRVLPTVYEGPGGVYFITSEKFTGSNGVSAARKYTIRQFTPDPVNIRSVAGFNKMTNRDEATPDNDFVAGHDGGPLRATGQTTLGRIESGATQSCFENARGGS